MKQYKIVKQYLRLKKTEEELNNLAKEGWIIVRYCDNSWIVLLEKELN